MVAHGDTDDGLAFIDVGDPTRFERSTATPNRPRPCDYTRMRGLNTRLAATISTHLAQPVIPRASLRRGSIDTSPACAGSVLAQAINTARSSGVETDPVPAHSAYCGGRS